MLKFNEEKKTKLLSILSEALIALKAVELTEAERAYAKENAPMNVVIIDILNRFESNLMAIKNLLGIESVEDFAAIRHSVGILLRSGLNDCMRVFIILNEMDSNDSYGSREKEQEIYLKINSDQIGSITGLLRSIESQGLKLNSKIEKDTALNFALRHKEFFIDLKNFKLKYPDKDRIISLTKEIIKNERFGPDGAQVFELWQFYSKFEHYGPMSYELLNVSPNDFFNLLVESLTYFIHSIAYLMDCFGPLKPTAKYLNDLKVELSKMNSHSKNAF